MKCSQVLASAAALTLGLAANGAGAAGEKPGRYTMSPTEGGFVRLDTETGEMSLCKRGGGGDWVCEPMADKQQAQQRELDRLRQENDALRRGSGPAPQDQERAPLSGPESPPDLAPPEGGSAEKIPIPTEQDVDKLFDYVEGMMKKLKERWKRLEEKENKGPETPL